MLPISSLRFCPWDERAPACGNVRSNRSGAAPVVNAVALFTIQVRSVYHTSLLDAVAVQVFEYGQASNTVGFGFYRTIHRGRSGARSASADRYFVEPDAASIGFGLTDTSS
jgi:hypothetical protein